MCARSAGGKAPVLARLLRGGRASVAYPTELTEGDRHGLSHAEWL
jgi:hypothetical protein